jgi:hypothetical protein
MVDDWALIRQRLTKQSVALIAGEESGWLAAVDPDDAKLLDHYRALYRQLRALRVSRWEYLFGDAPRFDMAAARSVLVGVRYCLASCPAAATQSTKTGVPDLSLLMDFARRGPDAQYLIAGVTTPDDDSTARPLPWEEADLVTVDGQRVTVAAPARLQSQLPEAVAAGDRAAAATDRYATLVGGHPPERYLVYLAGPAEWTSWRGGHVGPHYIGYAFPSGSLQFEVVVKIDPRQDLFPVLRHEFGHVVTLAGAPSDVGRTDSSNTWLKEGVAEYIRSPTPTLADPNVGWARYELTKKRRLTHLDMDSPAAMASDGQISAFYGFSHLAVSCMAGRFGETRMFAFFTAVVRDGKGPYDASTRSYGQDWDKVQATCLTDIYRTLHL